MMRCILTQKKLLSVKVSAMATKTFNIGSTEEVSDLKVIIRGDIPSFPQMHESKVPMVKDQEIGKLLLLSSLKMKRKWAWSRDESCCGCGYGVWSALAYLKTQRPN